MGTQWVDTLATPQSVKNLSSQQITDISDLYGMVGGIEGVFGMFIQVHSLLL